MGKKKNRKARTLRADQESSLAREDCPPNCQQEQAKNQLEQSSTTDISAELESDEPSASSTIENVNSEPPCQAPDNPGKSIDSILQVADSAFVFKAGSNCVGVEPLAAGLATRASGHIMRHRESRCYPSERSGKLAKKGSRYQNLQSTAQEQAFGQGIDPLSLVVTYEESSLRRVVRAPRGSTVSTVVDSSLRQALAGTALDSPGWQEALNQPRENEYFTYSTVPEGLTIPQFRESKGKIVVTSWAGERGLLKLKEDAEIKRKAAEKDIETVRQYLEKLNSEENKKITEQEHPGDKMPECFDCKSLRSQLNKLLELLKGPPPGLQRQFSSTHPETGEKPKIRIDSQSLP